MQIICPFCKQVISLKETPLNEIKCPNCNNIIVTSFFKDDESYIDMNKQASSFLEKNQFDKLFDLAQAMLNRWPNDFYSLLFFVCGQVKLDLTKPLPYVSYKLSNDEIQDDLKSRLYHYSRIKYSKASQNIYNGISAFYPDVACKDSKTGWIKARTSFDCKLDNLEENIKKVNIIAQSLSMLKNLSKSKKETDIIQRIYDWGDYLLKAKKELERYDEYATNLIEKDFINTPEPGHAPFARLYILLLCLSIILFLLTLSNLIAGSLIGFYNIFSQVSSIIISIYLIAMVVYFSIRLHLFSKGRHPIFASCLYVLSISLSILGIVSCFTNFTNMTNLIILYFSIVLASLVYLMITAIIKYKMYKSKKTSKSNTYLSDVNSLLKNNFTIKYEFDFKDIKKENI